jgi:hypothetical protein
MIKDVNSLAYILFEKLGKKRSTGRHFYTGLCRNINKEIRKKRSTSVTYVYESEYPMK